MANNGRFVTCNSSPPGVSMGPHQVDRVLCVFEKRTGCDDCVHHSFVIDFQVNIGSQVVACPRWETDTDRIEGRPAVSYVHIRREPCLRIRPFPWCPGCPNSMAQEPPRDQVGWHEREHGNKRQRVKVEPGRFELYEQAEKDVLIAKENLTKKRKANVRTE